MAGADGQHLYVAAGVGTLSDFRIGRRGSLTLDSCVGRVKGCAAVRPARALRYPHDLALGPDGRYLYLTGYKAISHLRIRHGGGLAFAGCIGKLAGCESTSPVNALTNTGGMVLRAQSSDFYVGRFGASTITHLTVRPDGSLSLAGCTGDAPGCAAINAPAALSEVRDLEVAPDGARLYSAAADATGRAPQAAAVSGFTFDPGGG